MVDGHHRLFMLVEYFVVPVIFSLFSGSSNGCRYHIQFFHVSILIICLFGWFE